MTILAAAIFLLSVSSQQDPLHLTLLCEVVGETASGTGRVTERVSVSLSAAENKIRIPSTLLPDVRGRSIDGWRPLTDLTVTESVIAGRVNLNIFNRPSVRIDRITGSIEVEGNASTNFSGLCEPVDPDARRF